jgi:hypothetical protein
MLRKLLNEHGPPLKSKISYYMTHTNASCCFLFFFSSLRSLQSLIPLLTLCPFFRKSPLKAESVLTESRSLKARNTKQTATYVRYRPV